MIGKIIGAELGRRLAGRDNAIKGALIGAALPWLARKAVTPIGIAIISAIVVKAVMDSRGASDGATPTARTRTATA